SYTVGGNSPDFTSPQEAADSLMVLGITGPVEILIRPGVYEGETDGDGPALFIDRPIAGTDRANRVVFRPDRSAGADTSNVILQRRIGGTVVEMATTFGIDGSPSHITLEGFAVVVKDTVAEVRQLDPVIRIAGQFRAVQVVDVQILNMKIDGGGRRASKGVSVEDDCTTEIEIVGNRFTEVAQAVRIFCPGAPAAPGFRFERNRVDGSGYAVGGCCPVYLAVVDLELGAAVDPAVIDNVVDMTAECGHSAIQVRGGTQNLRLERNHVINHTCGGGPGSDVVGSLMVADAAGYTVVANNMVSLGTVGTLFRNGGPAISVHQRFDSMLVAHNTTYSFNKGRGPRIEAVEASGAHVRILNNIFVAEREAALEPRGSFTRDYNVLSNGSELGPNSFVAVPEFVDPMSDLHLGECAFEDNTLHGLADLGILQDLDREGRSVVTPFRGADEPAGSPPEVFAGPTVYTSGTESFLMASGDLDDDGDIDLAVTNVEAGNGGNDVTILWNDGNGTFSDPEHLAFGTEPTHIEIGHLNADDFLDIVVIGRDGVQQRLGIGGGAFAPMVQISPPAAYTDLELADYDNDGDTDVFVVISASTDSGLVAVEINDGNGTYTFNNGWIVSEFADDLELADLDGDGFLDLLVVDNTGTNQLYTARNLGVTAPGVSAGYDTPVAYPLFVESVPAASQFMVGDFDGDLDLDVVLGDAAADSLVLVRNNGDGTFGGREAFAAHRRGAPRTATMLDYEGDGDLDLVVASSVSATDLLLNDGTGRFGRFILCQSGAVSGFPNAMLAANLDSDASTDVAVLTTNDTVEILTNLNWVSPISAEEPEPLPSANSELHPNYPNPFTHTTTVSYHLAGSARVRLAVFDLLGRRVATVVDGLRPAGKHSVTFDGSGLASGVYLYRISAGAFVDAGRMVVVR
ncbi:MAG: FG-GAP-like repeat-containing protein, partial [Rhodothermales bacterium]|nr:FG-GAP-like repeat-containing protein [Rhodothermales bacterium]